jgi:hypothetical protein
MSSDNRTTTFVFPYETLTKIDGEPTNATLYRLKQEIYANAMANECHLGCGTRGYLGIIMPTDEYLALQRDNAADNDDDDGELLAVAFQKPKPVATMNATRLQEERRALRDYCAMDTRLRNQITEAIAPQYYSELNKGELGIGRTTAQQLLAHLVKEYGTLTQRELNKNREELSAAWNSEKPIRELWDRVAECQRIAKEGGTAISDVEAMFTVLMVLDGTGVHSNYTSSWRQMHPLQASWDMKTFCAFFNNTEKERKERLTTKDVGYANAVIKGKTAATTTSPTTTEPTVQYVDAVTTQNVYYCWSHGVSGNPRHTGATCRSRATGHKEEATLSDIMGGFQALKVGKNKTPRTNDN